MSDCTELLVKLKSVGVKLGVENGNLKISAPVGVLTSELKNQLKSHKQELLELLDSASDVESNDFPAIGVVDRSLQHPLSFAQQRLWFLDQISPDLFVYNIPLSYRIHGALNVNIFGQALNKVIARHESLRTCFDGSSSDPVQKIVPQIDFKMTSIDLSSEVNQKEVLEKTLLSRSRKVFNLGEAPLFDACVFVLSESEFIFYFNVHHAIFDGGSAEVLLADLLEFYGAGVEERSCKLEPLPVQYLDYSVWQKSCNDSATIAKQLGYWAKKLDRLPEPIELPLDKRRPEIQEYEGAIESFRFSDQYFPKLSQLAVEQDASIFMVLLSILDVFLNKYSGSEDILIGTPIANRSANELDSLIGYFANTIVLRSEVGANKTFSELLSENINTCFDAYANQDVPFDRLVEVLNPVRDPSRTPLFQVFYAFQDSSKHSIGTSGLTFEPNGPAGIGSKTDLTFDFINSSAGFSLDVEYCSSLFEKETITKMIGHLDQLLSSVVDNPHQTVAELSLLSIHETEEMIAKNQLSYSDVNEEVFVCDSLAAFAMSHQNKIAVKAGSEELTYRQLEENSNKIANYLLGQGLEKGSLIGLCVDRSVAMLSTLFGILKIGCAYVPLDPEYPKDRLAYMIEDAGLCFLITQKDYVDLLPVVKTTFYINDLINECESSSAQFVAEDISENLLAYVIYTSGSTGNPKGVMVHRGAMLNFLASMSVVPGLNEADKFLAVTTLSFDIAVLELYLPILVGASVVIATREETIDGNALLDIIKSERITCMQATPATWRMLISAGWASNNRLKVLCGGEALAKDLAEELCEIGNELWNMYGPTETTVWSTCSKIEDPNQEITLGKAIANTSLFILDENFQMVPDGVAGELYIGGKGVTPGYLNRAELTAERFIKSPVTSEGKLYRTGDKVRRRLNGDLVYQGRLDNQVKLRGFRIELGEIESALRKSDHIKDCAVTVKEISSNDIRLVAYIVWTDEALSISESRDYLKKSLPSYMIPQVFVGIKELPRTPNGKLDSRALPALELDIENPSERIEPKTEIEIALAVIWKDILGLKKVGVNENFFDLGGHSLLIAKIIQQFEAKMSILLQYRDVFSFPTIEELAAKVDTMPKEELKSNSIISPRHRDVLPVLSLAQQRLWYLDQVNPDSNVFNLPAAFRFHGQLDIEKLNRALNKIISRHESLRTSIRDTDDAPYQFIEECLEIDLEVVDLHLSEGESEKKSLHMLLDTLRNTRLDIRKSPLFVTKLIKIRKDDFVLFFMPHHIIFDGFSFGVFINELVLFYEGDALVDLDPLPIQYPDYSIWLRELLSGTELDKQLSFWVELLQGELPVLDMPTDFPRPEVNAGIGGEVYFEIDKTLSSQLVQIAKENSSSLFMVLMAAYISLLHRYTGQSDFLVGSPMADRTRVGTENLLGFFVNALVLRFQFSKELTFSEILLHVKGVCLRAYSNQDVPFEKLVEVLNPDRDLSRAPLFQTSVTYQDVSQREFEMESIGFEELQIPVKETPLDISIWFENSNSVLGYGIIYNTDLFTRETVEQFSSHFRNLLKCFVADEYTRVAKAKFLGEAEKVQLLAASDTTSKVWSDDGFFHELIEKQAKRVPEKIAARYRDEKINYKELEERSNHYANFLISEGVKGNDMVGLCVDRSLDMLIAILGILKSGCAYVPLDPEYPSERLSYMIDDSRLSYLIVSRKHLDRLPEVPNIYLLEELKSETQSQSAESPNVNINQDDAAYVIYTSGSTGNPKGVVVPHGAVANFLNSMALQPGLSESDSLLAVTTLSFDISVLELYLPLTVGATVTIAAREEAIDGRKLLKIIQDQKISCMQATPATWRMLMGAGWTSENSIKVLCGGEALPKDLAAELFERSTELWNMYGPTETTVWSTCQRVEDINSPVTLGKAIANTSLFVLDEQYQLVPKGVAGELYIGGDGVTKGYLNRKELTAERFVLNPISGEGVIYRTGDKVKFNRAGELEYLGRLDSQVKLRGFRIELGEIETSMRKHENIEDCALAIKEPVPGDVRLVAYIVWAGNPVTLTELRKFLKQWMPAHMIPQTLVDINVLPRTPNGKLDRKALPDVFTSVTESASFVEPNTDVSRWLAKTWQEVIGVKQIGLNDNFFDAGGHSLLSMQVIYKIKHQYDVSLSPRDLLLETLEQHANKIQANLVVAEADEKMESAPVKEAGDKKDSMPEGKKKKGLMARLFK